MASRRTRRGKAGGGASEEEEGTSASQPTKTSASSTSSGSGRVSVSQPTPKGIAARFEARFPDGGKPQPKKVTDTQPSTSSASATSEDFRPDGSGIAAFYRDPRLWIIEYCAAHGWGDVIRAINSIDEGLPEKVRSIDDLNQRLDVAALLEIVKTKDASEWDEGYINLFKKCVPMHWDHSDESEYQQLLGEFIAIFCFRSLIKEAPVLDEFIALYKRLFPKDAPNDGIELNAKARAAYRQEMIEFAQKMDHSTENASNKLIAQKCQVEHPPDAFRRKFVEFFQPLLRDMRPPLLDLVKNDIEDNNYRPFAYRLSEADLRKEFGDNTGWRGIMSQTDPAVRKFLEERGVNVEAGHGAAGEAEADTQHTRSWQRRRKGKTANKRKAASHSVARQTAADSEEDEDEGAAVIVALKESSTRLSEKAKKDDPLANKAFKPSRRHSDSDLPESQEEEHPRRRRMTDHQGSAMTFTWVETPSATPERNDPPRLPTPKKRRSIVFKDDMSPSRRSPEKRVRRRKFWGDDEVDNLIKGVKRFGLGKWKQILDEYDFPGRTSVDLKDKYRNLVRLQEKEAERLRRLKKQSALHPDQAVTQQAASDSVEDIDDSVDYSGSQKSKDTGSTSTINKSKGQEKGKGKEKDSAGDRPRRHQLEDSD